MAYSVQDLKEIRQAERLFWESSYFHLGRIAWQRATSPVNQALTDGPSRVAFVVDFAKVQLERWRLNFAPSRVGLPIESEWTP